ncbi:hypothetical protein [Streptomyces sp. NPDC001389]|uniref:hypothetical protein n=1 Tax=Streptomyces sp. NPDC001389 TaxID=3364569 RepID=UPI0036D16AE0
MNTLFTTSSALAGGAGQPASAAPDAAQGVTAVLIGLLFALAAAILARQDGASLPVILTRAGAACAGIGSLALTLLCTTKGMPTVVVLLASLLTSSCAGALAWADGKSVPTAIWRGGIAFTSLMAIGLGALALYL